MCQPPNNQTKKNMHQNTKLDELRENEIEKITMNFDLKKAANRRLKFELERSFAFRHQTPDRFIFDSPAFQPTPFDF